MPILKQVNLYCDFSKLIKSPIHNAFQDFYSKKGKEPTPKRERTDTEKGKNRHQKGKEPTPKRERTDTKKGKNRHRKGKEPTPKRERTDTFLTKHKYYDLITNAMFWQLFDK